MIRNLLNTDRNKIEKILFDTNNFNPEEIKIAMELVDVYINDPAQKDYEIFVDEAENKDINGYVCVGPRPLTTGKGMRQVTRQSAILQSVLSRSQKLFLDLEEMSSCYLIGRESTLV